MLRRENHEDGMSFKHMVSSHWFMNRRRIHGKIVRLGGACGGSPSTTAVGSATSSPPPLAIAVGNGANDGEAGNAGPASSTTLGEFRILLSTDVDDQRQEDQRQEITKS